jgi:hypothetical protein
LDPGRLSDMLFFFLENYLASIHFWNQKNDIYEIEGYWISKNGILTLRNTQDHIGFQSILFPTLINFQEDSQTY